MVQRLADHDTELVRPASLAKNKNVIAALTIYLVFAVVSIIQSCNLRFLLNTQVDKAGNVGDRVLALPNS